MLIHEKIHTVISSDNVVLLFYIPFKNNNACCWVFHPLDAIKVEFLEDGAFDGLSVLWAFFFPPPTLGALLDFYEQCNSIAASGICMLLALGFQK